MTWHYAIRGRRLAEVYEGLESRNGSTGGYCVLGWRDVPTIVRDVRWVIKGIRYDRRKAAA